ncbi:MAG: hypothetical protein CO107_08745, partial [Deltaproteobacteria bacterium CG_4_9_14_3_um_filter_51_14]
MPEWAQRRMKMPHVFPDLILNPGMKDCVPAPGSVSGTGCAAITFYFRKRSHVPGSRFQVEGKRNKSDPIRTY